MVKPAIYTISPEEGKKQQKALEAGILEEIPIKTDHSDTDHIVKIAEAPGTPRCSRRSRYLAIAFGTTLILVIAAIGVFMLFTRCESKDKEMGNDEVFPDDRYDKFLGGHGWRGEDRGGSSEHGSTEEDGDHGRWGHRGGGSSSDEQNGRGHHGPPGRHGPHGEGQGGGRGHGSGEEGGRGHGSAQEGGRGHGGSEEGGRGRESAEDGDVAPTEP